MDIVTDVGAHYLYEAQRTLGGYKRLADAALAQLSDEELGRAPDAESNSVAILLQHIAGNQRSRFTDFLSSDGEKPERQRDAEFEPSAATRAQLLEAWERGWRIVFDALAELRPPDLLRTVSVRGQPLTVLQAIERQVTHCAYHAGQIVYLAKHWKGAAWHSLSIPKGKSLGPEALEAERRRP